MDTTHHTAAQYPAAPSLHVRATRAAAALVLTTVAIGAQLGLAAHYANEAEVAMATQASQPLAQQSRPATPQRS